MTELEAKATGAYMYSEGFADITISDWRNGEFPVYGCSGR